MHTNAAHQEGLGQRTAGQIGRELLSRQPLLTVFAGSMLVLALPTAVMLAVDDRTWRDVAIWAKPLKFMLSTAAFAATTAWFVGLLPRDMRTSPTVRGLAWAVVLTATQAVLAGLIWRHSAERDTVFGRSVVIGLLLTFVLATARGFMLGGQQPPAGVGLPVVGWHLDQADARPAHFMGVHAHQWVPLAGWLLQRYRVSRPSAWMAAFAAAYVVTWSLLTLRALP